MPTMSLLNVVILAAVSIGIALARLGGETGDVYKDAAHLWTGGLLLACWYAGWVQARSFHNAILRNLCKQDAKALGLMAVVLIVVELYAAAPKILALLNPPPAVAFADAPADYGDYGADAVRPSDPYTRAARLVRVLDADTLDVQVDLGFRIYHTITVRLARVQAAEKDTPDGPKWTQFTQDWLAKAPALWITTKRDRTDRYKRYLAEVSDGSRSLCDDLLAAGCPAYK